MYYESQIIGIKKKYFERFKYKLVLMSLKSQSFGISIDSSDWYRLTLEYKHAGQAYSVFRVLCLVSKYYLFLTTTSTTSTYYIILK